MGVAPLEVSCQTTAAVLDGLQQAGIEVEPLLTGLPVTALQLSDPRQRVSWDTFVQFMDRVQAACGGPAGMTALAVPGVAARTLNPFLNLARAALSLNRMYRLFAVWGISNHMTSVSATYTDFGPGRARIVIDIDPDRRGSAATLNFVAGILRNLPRIHGLPDAEVSLTVSPQQGVYDLDFAVRGSILWRLRRRLDALRNSGAMVEQVIEQGVEIGEQNRRLREQVIALNEVGDQLREQQQWLSIALDAAKMGLWSVDLSTRRSRVTPAFWAMTGLHPESEHDAVAALLARVHPDDQHVLDAANVAARAHNTPIDVEYRYHHPDGSLIWLNGKGHITRDAEGRPALVTGTIANVTERKSLEQQLRFADRLISTGTLAAGIAHEINNPLTYILGNIEQVQHLSKSGPVAPDAMAALLADMSSGVVRVRDVVKDLRTFSHPIEGEIEVLDLRQVIAAASRLVGHQLRHQVTTTFSFPDTPLTVRANEVRLGQVFVNLLANAAYAMPPRPVDKNEVSVRGYLSDEGWATVEVRDNGAGISPSAVDRLFDPFYSPRTPGTATGPAVGLGLSLSRAIVVGLGGTIEVESDLGVGTTFRIALPTVARAVQPARPAGPAPESGRPATGRVLIVDDEPLVRRALARMLARDHITVEEADDGQTALELLMAGAAPFDAIICDLMMPRLSGVELHEELQRRLPAQADRMIFLSGGAVTPSAQEFVARSRAAMLTKPITGDQLRAALAPVLRRDRA